MPFKLFHDLFPEIAERENRTITVFPDSGFDLPAAEYSFLEMYCDEPDCDCRRAFFYVISSRTEQLEAVITFGWEPPSFYAAWMRDAAPHILAELKGPSLNVGSPQAKHAPAILEVVRNVLLRDASYVERLKRHYKIFRSKIDSPKMNEKEISMEINFECKKCGGVFDCNAGAVSVSEETGRPQFENEIHCPKCWQRTIDDVLLTELGQSQLTAATLDIDFEDLTDEENALFGFEDNEGECQGCDEFRLVNDLGLCNECSGKLDRDLIRQRDWDHSASAFGVPPVERDKLRRKVIAQYGEKLELIAPSGSARPKSKKKNRRKRQGAKGKSKR